MMSLTKSLLLKVFVPLLFFLYLIDSYLNIYHLFLYIMNNFDFQTLTNPFLIVPAVTKYMDIINKLNQWATGI